MAKEIEFLKYKLRGANYHYQQIDKRNIRKFNSFVYARYIKHIKIVEEYLVEMNFSKTQTINVLDVGCGDGALLFLLKKNIKDFRFEIYGVDLSDIALDIARKKMPEGQFSKKGAYYLGFPNETFDLILSSDVIEHVLYPEKMLSEIKRVSKEKVLVVIGTPIRLTENPLDLMHVQEFFQNEFVNLISQNFEFLKLEESHKQIHFLNYTKQILFSKVNINKYLYNILSFLGKNPFLEKVKKPQDFPIYMYAICKL